MEYRVMNIHETGADQLQAWFSQADQACRERLSRFRRQEDRLRSLCADHLAREMLSAKLGRSPDELVFRRTEKGKPYLDGFPLHFNLSHSGDFVACAISEAPIGVDIEALRPIREELCKKVCGADELAYVYPDGKFHSERFLRLWTAKEAILKQSGEGIASDLRFPEVVHGEKISYPTLCLYQDATTQYIITIAYQ